MTTSLIRELLEQTREVLAYHQQMGVSELPSTPEMEKFLAGSQSGAAPATGKAAPLLCGKTGQKAASQNPEPTPKISISQPLAEICLDIDDCTKCELHRKRSRIIAGSGSGKAGLLIIEDQPSGPEEKDAHPFAGEAGELFDRMLKAINLKRQEVYLTSLVKCRPPEDRDADQEEIQICLPYLTRQIAAVNPAVICVMGPLSAGVLTGSKEPLFRIRGRFHDFHGTPLMATFHPRFLLRNEEMKKGSWQDLQLIQKKLISAWF